MKLLRENTKETIVEFRQDVHSIFCMSNYHGDGETYKQNKGHSTDEGKIRLTVRKTFEGRKGKNQGQLPNMWPKHLSM